MDSLGNLLALYAGIIFCNLGLALVLWWRQRARLQLALCCVWAAGVVSFVLQGVLHQGDFLLTVGFSSSFLSNLALAFLLAELTQLSLPVSRYVVGYLAGLSGSGLMAWLGAPFWGVALPTAVCIAIPLLHTTVRALRAGDVLLTTTGKAYILVCFAFIAHNLDFPFLRQHEELVPLAFTVALLIGWALSMTALAVVLERVAEERAKIAELDKLKSRFFANVSHELRTPLTLILSPIEALLEDGRAAAFRESLRVVYRNAQRLLRLIDDILDLSKLEAGALRLRIAEVNVGALAQRVVELAEPAASARRQVLRCEVAPGVPPIFGDPHRLEMVFTNLVGNAIKYVQEGGHVNVSVSADSERVCVAVEDDGPGIATARQAQVFERFIQDPTRTGAGGVGIGLALARELAELHGGSLTLRSAPGQGSTFTVSLRLGDAHFVGDVVERRQAQLEPHPQRRRVDAVAVAELDVSPARDELPLDDGPLIRLEGGRLPRVLLVEDEVDLRTFISRIVSRECEVIEAADGRRALEIIARQRPDLVLTDVMMPNVSGTELCQRLKSDASTRGIPVILLTARSGVEAAIEGYSSGADDFVAKPFHPRVLMARIRSHLTVRQLGLQLADHARLASAGSLAAGVAHEVRNPLNAVANAAEALRQHQSTVPPEALLAVIVDGVKRIASVIDALDVHARPAEGLDARPCAVREGVEATLRLLQHRAQGVEVRCDIADSAEVFVPARAFHQVLTNLLDNALRAARREVRLAVESGADMVTLVIEDDGDGVAEDLRERIFDPFFTTRDVGEGRGLGLYLSRRLCRDLGGDLWVEAAFDGGARFVARVPAREAPAHQRAV